MSTKYLTKFQIDLLTDKQLTDYLQDLLKRQEDILVEVDFLADCHRLVLDAMGQRLKITTAPTSDKVH